MKRISVFAHHSPDNKIDDYVLYYLESLKKVCDKIIFVSDCNIKDDELDKIPPFAEIKIAKKHDEYDFGSYKRGFLYALNNNLTDEYDEVIFANDSCYAPLFNFETMFKKMEEKNADFWGATYNYADLILDDKLIKKNQKHIQSYFLVFKKNVFKSDVFINFINSIKKENNKDDIVAKYEIKLTELLEQNGFSSDIYANFSKLHKHSHLEYYSELITQDCSPFLKRSVVLLRQNKFTYPVFLKKLIKKTEYDYDLIKKDIEKNRTVHTSSKILASKLRAIKKIILRVHTKEGYVRFLNFEYRFK